MVDRFNRIFLRTLRALRDLRRYSSPVIVQNARQVNIGEKQVNVATLRRTPPAATAATRCALPLSLLLTPRPIPAPRRAAEALGRVGFDLQPRSAASVTLAGDKLHWFIEQFLKKGPSSRDWAERTCTSGFDLAVRYSRDPKANAGLQDLAYPPPMLLEFYYGDPRAEELAAKAREALCRGIRKFLEHEPVKKLWSEITAGEHYVEQRVGGLPKFDEFGIEGQIDLVGRDTDRVRVVDWKLGMSGGSHDSLQMLIYGLWAEKQFQVEPSQVSARRVFLADGTVEPERPLDRGMMVVGRARMLQDIEFGRTHQAEARV